MSLLFYCICFPCNYGDLLIYWTATRIFKSTIKVESKCWTNNKEIKQNGKDPENFDIYFYLTFVPYYQSVISGKVKPTPNNKISQWFMNFLQS